MQTSLLVPTTFEVKRRSCNDCGQHHYVGSAPVRTQFFGTQLSAAEIRERWENIVWCNRCHQWVQMRKGCVEA